jgi:hypothetical protein
VNDCSKLDCEFYTSIFQNSEEFEIKFVKWINRLPNITRNKLIKSDITFPFNLEIVISCNGINYNYFNAHGHKINITTIYPKQFMCWTKQFYIFIKTSDDILLTNREILNTL